jgi:hypothetical protein
MLLSLVLVTLASDDLNAFIRTERSIRSQSTKVRWMVVTPNKSSELYEYANRLLSNGFVESIELDAGEGIYQAMNFSLSKMNSSDWVWFMNAGDTFSDKDSYSKICCEVNITSHKWIYGSHFLGSSSGEVLGQVSVSKRFNRRKQLFARQYVCHQSAIFKVGFLNELEGFRTDYHIAADWDLLVRASKHDPGKYVGFPISIFYMGGYSTLNRESGNKELLNLRKEHLPFLYILPNYSWYFYRKIRNKAINKIEILSPAKLNLIRKIRLFLILKTIRFRIFHR